MNNLQISDNQLKEIIKNYIETINKFEDRIVSFKDEHLCYVMVTNAYAQAYGAKNPSELVGLDDEKLLNSKQPSTIQQIKESDSQVLKSKIPKKIFKISNNDSDSGFNIIETFKKPIINPLTNNIVGILSSTNKVELHSIPDFIWTHLRLRDNNQQKIVLISEKTKLLNVKYRFTAIELDIIFFYLLGYSASEISRIWALYKYNLKTNKKPKTAKNIRDIKAQISSKLGLSAINQTNIFISFFKNLGFHNYTPLNIYERFMNYKE